MRNQVFKKLFSVLLALIMAAGLLPASAMAEGWGAMDVDTTPVPTETVQPTESAEPTAPTETETPEVTEVPEPTPENPAATVEPAAEPTPAADPTDEGIMAANVMPVQANVELQYRIVHLDCGRKYFSKDWIIALINEMAGAGYNQLQLAFGNGGFRFYLNDMAIDSHSSDEVKNALEAGNNHYNTYGDDENGPNNKEWIVYNPSKNALTETEMNAIIEHAQRKGIEIVPMLNTPGHMHAVLAAMKQLNIAGDLQVSSKHGCLNLSNTEAVSFTKALVEKYVDYFASKGCKFFNFAMDEYSSFDTSFFTYANYLIAYANAKGVTPRVFNDALKTNGGFIKGTQVCCWDSILNTGNYSIINTSHDFYYVSTNENWNLQYEGYTFVGEYAEATWIEHAKKFDNNVFLYKKESSKISPVGSMFCIWCNTPGKNNETQIAQQIRMILRVIGARMQNSNEYKTTDILIEGGFKADGTINVPTNTTTVGNVSGNTTADSDTVRVTGPNLTALTAPEHTGEIAGIKAVDGRIMAYDVTPSTADNEKYTGEAEVRIKIPAEWDSSKVIAFIVESDGTVKDIADGKVDGEWYVFTAPHFSVMGIYEKAATTGNGGTITIVEGKEEVLTVDGKVNADDIGDPADTTVAIKTGIKYDTKPGEGTLKLDGPITTGEGVISDGKGNYLVVSEKGIISNTTEIADATVFNVTSSGYGITYYTIQVKGKNQYLTINNSKELVIEKSYSSSSWRYKSDGYYQAKGNVWDSTNYYLEFNNNAWTVSTDKSGKKGYLYKRVESQNLVDITQITFKGLKVGATTVTIAGVVYTINVTAADLENEVLPINLWITNTGVVPTGWSNGTPTEFTYNDDKGNRRSIYTLKASYRNANSSVNSSNGIKLSSILPNVTGTATSWDNNTYSVTYWKSAYHTAGNRQSTDGWTNNSHKGTKFEYIRFFEGSWAYSVDGNTWENIENVGAEAGDTTKNQVCIWYRQVTTVTSEVTTEIVDWGPIDYKANQCLLDFAVKYDGTLDIIPNSFPVPGKTIGFDIAPSDNETYYGNDNGASYRTVYGIAGVETAAYEVYMITLTPSSDSHNVYINSGSTQTSYTYGGTEKIAWAKTEADANSAELYKMPNVQYGGEPFLESVKIYQYQGLLVTYYLRAKQTEDSLTVHYAIQGSETAFYEYNIAVEKGITFEPNITLNPKDNDTVGGPLLNGKVINSNNETITVSSNLATLQGLEPQYRYSKYKIAGFNRKDDKNVWIYYTFTREHTYVIDFGLPLKIKFIDFGVTNDAEINTVSLWENEIVHENKGLYGTAKVITESTEGKYVLYTLDKPLDKNITIPLYVEFNKRDGAKTKQLFTANIIPATSVYYEDSFAKFTHGSGAAADAMWTPVGTTNTNTTQALEALGQENHNPYGYDPAYDSSTTFSMGSAHKVTVTSDMAKDGVVWPTAQFTFKGTGFDIISLTDNTSGAIFVFVYKGTDTSATGTRVKSHIVDNYYGYTQDGNGNWVVNNNANNALYQIPVMRIRGLEYGEYTAVVKVFYDNAFDHTATGNSYSFWLDAVRVYDPMGASVNTGNTYGQDGEAYPQYIKLRSELKKLNSDGTASSGALFIDGKENANISEYANYGPNNEVYLAKGQAITFKLADNDLSKIATVQIGAKAPMSKGTAKLNVKNVNNVNNTDVVEKELSTATEMYYDITTKAVNNGTAELVTITNTGEAILSLTNLKITFTGGNQTVSLGEVSAEQQTQAVQMVRALFAPAPVEPEPEPEPEKTFEPERFEASWSRNVMQGRKATLTVKTSEDVEAITVDGQTIRSYRTRTERVGFGRRAKRITYREFTYSMVAQESADFSVTAINAEGTESEAITARLTVKTRPNSMRDMWDWFKGWF